MASGVVWIDSSERLCRLGNLVLSGQLAWPSHPGLHEFPKSAAEPPQHAVGLAYFARAGPEFRPCCCDAAASPSPAVARTVGRRASPSAMAAGRPTAATGRRHPMAVVEGATRRVAVARRVRCSRRPARAADSPPRCHSSPTATSRSIARPASSSAGAVVVTALPATASEGDSESLGARA